jgi:hypothetical protein
MSRRKTTLEERQREMRARERQKPRTGRPWQEKSLAPTLETRVSWARMTRAKSRAYLSLRLGKSVDAVAAQLSRDLGKPTSREVTQAWIDHGCPLMALAWFMDEVKPLSSILIE